MTQAIFGQHWISRFWGRVDQSGDCWEWTGYRDKDGYGKFYMPRDNQRSAHRVAWMMFFGAFPKGVLDHLCRNRACVNPCHLREVTPRENTLENSESPAAINTAKQRCPKGHDLFGGNLYSHGGRRHCRACRQENDEARRPGRKEYSRNHKRAWRTQNA